MAKWIVMIIFATAVLTAVVFYIMNMISYNKIYSEYLPLISPKISEKKSEKMLTVAVYGDPSSNLGPAFGALYNTFFKLNKYGNTMQPSAPRARWPFNITPETPKEEWKGIEEFASEHPNCDMICVVGMVKREMEKR